MEKLEALCYDFLFIQTIDYIRLFTISMYPFSFNSTNSSPIENKKNMDKSLKNDNTATSSIKQQKYIKMEIERACRVKVKIFLKSELSEVDEMLWTITCMSVYLRQLLTLSQ